MFSHHTETIGTIEPGKTFHELGTIVHEGKSFSAQGATVTDDYLTAYLGTIQASKDVHIGTADYRREHHGPVQTWQGEIIGWYVITKTWKVRSAHSYHEMSQVSIKLLDGRRYQGRSQGPGMVVTAKRIAADRRVK